MSEPFMGEVKIFAGNFAPRGYAFCNGQIISISQNTALFSLLGTTFGGNGQTTFQLPDLRGRSPVHPGQGTGLSLISAGEVGGQESVTLTSLQMPIHNHVIGVTGTVNCFSSTGNKRGPALNVLAGDASGDQMYSDQPPDGTLATNSFTGAGTCSTAGGSQPVEIRSPYLGINFIVALQGIFPSRN